MASFPRIPAQCLAGLSGITFLCYFLLNFQTSQIQTGLSVYILYIIYIKKNGYGTYGTYGTSASSLTASRTRTCHRLCQ